MPLATPAMAVTWSAKRRVVYRQRAGHEWALLPVGQRAYNPPFSQSRIGRSLPHEACRGGLQTQDAPCGSPSSTLPSFYLTWYCCHGGTRYSSTSLNLHARSISPATIAGVRGCQRVMAPVSGIVSSSGRGTRKLAWGNTKLWYTWKSTNG